MCNYRMEQSLRLTFQGIQLNDALILKDVLYLPIFSFNLISFSKLAKSLNFLFSGHTCCIEDLSKRTIGLARLDEGFYHLELLEVQDADRDLQSGSSSFYNSVSIPDCALWRFRLGHVSLPLIEKLSAQLPYVHINKIGVCDICHFAKHRRTNFVTSKSRAMRPFDLLHMDIWGPYSISSVHNHRYFFTVVVDFSRFTWIVLLKGKHEVQAQVQKFAVIVETQFETRVK